jgi:hypothetical protein
MRPKSEVRASGEPAEIQPQPSYDHMQAVREEAPSFNRSWLKNGESMPLIQRAGFTVFSLVFFLYGPWLLVGAVQMFQEGDVVFVLYGLASTVLLFVGFLGLRNVLRFKL